MLFLIVGDNKIARKEKLAHILEPFSESEIIVFDDTAGRVADLQQYLYPSLFSSSTPIVHAQFTLGDGTEYDLVKKIVASPTVFIFEELELPTPLITLCKKAGGIVHTLDSVKVKKEQNDIFSATACITGKDKKSRWLAYRTAVEKHSIEAIMGILYWKVRTLIAKQDPHGVYKELYSKLLDAHTRSWQTGASLEILVEKVLLS